MSMMREEMIGKEIDGYTLQAKIGQGQLGSVYRAVDEYGRLHALKLIHPQLLAKRKFVKKLTPKWTSIPAKNATKEEDPNYCFSKTTYFPNGSLGNYIANLEKSTEEVENEPPRWFSQKTAFTIVHEIFQNRWRNNQGREVHGGIHPNNIMLTLSNHASAGDGAPLLSKINLIDMGDAQLAYVYLPKSTMPTTTQSRLYWEKYVHPPLDLLTKLLPQTFSLAEQFSKNYNPDMYAMGVLLYYLLFGHHPHLPLYKPDPSLLPAELLVAKSDETLEKRVKDGKKRKARNLLLICNK